jgi:hypothetical protein
MHTLSHSGHLTLFNLYDVYANKYKQNINKKIAHSAERKFISSLAKMIMPIKAVAQPTKPFNIVFVYQEWYSGKGFSSSIFFIHQFSRIVE